MSAMHDLPSRQAAAGPEPVPEVVVPAQRRLHAVPVEPLDFEDVVRRLTPRLQRYATRRLGDRHEAEELVQEALLRAYDARAKLATEDDVAAWTTCVTGRLVIDRLRVRGRSTSVADVPEGTRLGRDTADVVVARDEARTALDALDAMPPRQAAVLWAREVEGLSYGDIGERFGMTEPAVRSLLSRARSALRKEFASRGGTLPAAGGLAALAPWTSGLSWLDRLREVAGRAAAPTALGLAGIGLVGGALLAPWAGDQSPPAPTAVVPLAAAPVAAEPLPVDAQPVAASTDPAPKAADDGVGIPAPAGDSPPPAPTLTAAERLPTRDVCLEVGAAGAGGGECAPERQGGQWFLDLALPANPTGIRALGLETFSIDCQRLPDLPLTSCRSVGGGAEQDSDDPSRLRLLDRLAPGTSPSSDPSTTGGER